MGLEGLVVSSWFGVWVEDSLDGGGTGVWVGAEVRVEVGRMKTDGAIGVMEGSPVIVEGCCPRGSWRVLRALSIREEAMYVQIEPTESLSSNSLI